MPIGRVGTDSVVNTTVNSNQYSPTVATLAEGRYLFAWISNEGSPSGVGLERVRGRIFNADGSPTGSDFVINTSSNPFGAFFGIPAIAALPDGRFLVTWDSSDTADGSYACVRGRWYNSNGTAIGNDFVVDTTWQGDQKLPSVTTLSDGRIVVTWESHESSDGFYGCIRARVYNSDRSPAGNDFLVNTTNEGYQGHASVTALADGGFAIAWFSGDAGDGTPGCIRARIYSSSLTPDGPDFIVNSTTPGDQSEPVIATLADGRLVVAWTSADGGDGSGYCIRARIYDANGVPVADDFVVDSTGVDYQQRARIAGLADGRFVIAWDSYDTGDGSDACIRARLFNIDGTPNGNDFIVNTIVTGVQYFSDVTALPNGRFIVTWTSFDTGDGAGSCIRSQTFDPTVFVGTNGGDTWQGGNLADTINGGDGDDALSGHAGNDTIIGGVGADELSGEEGNDQLFGGDGGDRLLGGSGDDTLVGNICSDQLYGGDGNDVIIADNADTTIDGGAGYDTVNLIATSAGIAIRMDAWNVEQVFAGTGDDIVFTYGTAAIIVNGGPGSDTISGSVFGDFLVGGDDGDSIKGFAGSDIISGETGNDTLSGDGGPGVAGHDRIYGGTGNDTINGDDGVDQLYGGDGDDLIYFAFDDSVVDGGAGMDTAANTGTIGGAFDMGVHGIEIYYGGPNGESVFTTVASQIAVDAGGGNDAISGSGFGDTLAGNTGNDLIDGGDSNDTLGGGSGSDRLLGGIGADVLFGEADPDSYIYRGMQDGGDTIVGFETAALFGANGDKLEIWRNGFLQQGEANLGALDPNRFVAGPATLATGQFLFDTVTGRLFWDGDGTGAAQNPVLLLTLQGVSNLTAFDFVLV